MCGGLKDLSTKCHIASLPPEVLTSIFIQVKAIDEIENWDKKQLEWIKITHVCKYWREVGIRTRCLWTNIPMYSEEWAVEMLQRSKDMSITVTVDLARSSVPYPSAAALQKMYENFPRMQELNVIKATHQEAAPFLNLTLPTDLPLRLHTVRFGGDTIRYDHSDILCFKDSTFFPNLNLSSLRRLSLLDCHLDWKASSGFLRNLTHIRVISDHKHDLLDKGVEPFLNVLRGMPFLESLDFEYFAGPHRVSEVHPLPVHFEKVALNHLKILRLGVQMRQLDLILDGLDVPPDALMKLYCYETSASFSLFPGVLSSYASHLVKAGTPIRSFELSNYCEKEFRITAWTTVIPLESLNVVDIPPIMETIFCLDQSVDHTTEMIYQHALKSLNLDHLESLKIRDWSVVDGDAWAATFGALPKVGSIDLGNTRIRGLSRALASYIDDDVMNPGAKRTPAFPSLRAVSLSLSRVFLKDRLRQNQKIILDAVKLRSSIGLGLQHLVIWDTEGLSRKIMNQIREIVPVVEKSWTPEQNVYAASALNAYRRGSHDLDDTDALMGVWR